MPCFKPLAGYRKPGGGWTPSPMLGYRDRPMKVACGQCIGCRLEQSRQWAIRCYHEAQLHEDNCFITLTYDDHALEQRGHRSLDHRDWQLFMKRYRKRFGAGIRFLMCGEYGTWCRSCWKHPKQCKCTTTTEGPGRPHFHAIIFNHDFEDKQLWKKVNDLPLHVSPTLQGLWPSGFSSVGAATFQSAAYVARYITKKVTGKPAQEHYAVMEPQTGELTSLRPEYLEPSRRPGIAATWLKEFSDDVWPDDFIVVEGRKMRPPRFYERQLEVVDPDLHRQVKRKRQATNLARAEDNTPARLAVREKVQTARFNRLPRNLD